MGVHWGAFEIITWDLREDSRIGSGRSWAGIAHDSLSQLAHEALESGWPFRVFLS